jgi:cupin superfamily protein
MPTDAQLCAAEFTGRLWAAIGAAGGTRPTTPGHRYFPAVFHPAWLAGLSLPAGRHRPPGQPVALLDGRDGVLERYRTDEELWKAYARRPRTFAYENINFGAGGAWYSLVAQHLGRLARCELEVVCSIFQSTYGDETLGAHEDAWYGAIVQMWGTKTWHVGTSPGNQGAGLVSEVTTRAGDVLLIPKRLSHDVFTPPEPGYSTHVAFAIDRDPQSDS